jgi:hypothetical protein
MAKTPLQGGNSQCSHPSKTANIKSVPSRSTFSYCKGIDLCFLRPYHTLNAFANEHQDTKMNVLFQTVSYQLKPSAVKIEVIKILL